MAKAGEPRLNKPQREVYKAYPEPLTATEQLELGELIKSSRWGVPVMIVYRGYFWRPETGWVRIR
jgi:hypothetical protein